MVYSLQWLQWFTVVYSKVECYATMQVQCAINKPPVVYSLQLFTVVYSYSGYSGLQWFTVVYRFTVVYSKVECYATTQVPVCN